MVIADEQVQAWEDDGFVVLPGFLGADDLEAAVAALPSLFPTAEGFHDRTDERHARFRGDEFAGIDPFPMASVEVSLACAHPRLLALARTLLGHDDLRIYAAEAWAKYTGAADYDQLLHRDQLNHTVLVPSDDPAFRQLELFVYLGDVPEELGPPHYVSNRHTRDLPLRPNWRPRPDFPELYAVEVPAAGPLGTVVAYRTDTLHRGAALRAPRGARFTLHVNLRPAAAEWGQRMGWADVSFDPGWAAFVATASVEQLRAFGFPPPGHPMWSEQVLAGTAERYPGFDPSPWRGTGGSA